MDRARRHLLGVLRRVGGADAGFWLLEGRSPRHSALLGACAVECVVSLSPGIRRGLGTGHGAGLHANPLSRHHHALHGTAASSAYPAAAARGFAASALCQRQGPGPGDSVGDGLRPTGSRASGCVTVDEAAVQRLVQHSKQVTQQHWVSQKLTPEEVAARVRVLLEAGLAEADVAAVITKSRGGPYCAAQQLEETVGLIRRELCGSSQQLARIIHKAPNLLSWKPKALQQKLAWWRGQARNAKQLPAIRNSLRQFPCVLNMATATVRLKLQLLQEKLHASDVVMARKLPVAMQLVQRDITSTTLPRIDLLIELLGERVRPGILNHLGVLTLTQEGTLATLSTLSELMGSRELAVGMLARCLLLLGTGTQLRRNFQSLCSLAGGAEAARAAASGNPHLLVMDCNQPVMLHRAKFWQAQLGLSTAELLQQGYGALLRSRLDTVGPRWAWIQRHKDGHGWGAKYIAQSDEECMERYRVPLEGFAQFKKEWLASEEGRELCSLERNPTHSRRDSDSEEEGAQRR